MTNNQEVLELAKKCGASVTTNSYNHLRDEITFSSHENFIAFVAALEAKMIAEGWRQCAKGQGKTQHCAQAVELQAQIAMLRYICNKEGRGFSARECFYELASALSATKQPSETFLAEVRAKAKIELLREMIEDLRGVDNEGSYWAHNLQAIIDKLEEESELRNSAAQPEGKEGK